jgi:multidrug efflux pump subunit AcrA (membrane-fusion protein)
MKSATDDVSRSDGPGPNRPRALALLVRVVLPIGIVVSGLVLFVMLSLEPDQATLPAAAPQAIRTRVTELRVRDYPVVITTHGVVQPHNAVTLSVQISGQIAHLSPSFETGSYFSEGEVLVEVDPRDYQIALAVAEARQLGTQSALQLAALNHERNLKLAQDKLISDTVADQSAATLAQASAEVDSARAQVDRARQDLERTRIRAPFPGRVRQRTVGLGQIVGPGMPLGAAFAVDFAEVRLPISGRETRPLHPGHAHGPGERARYLEQGQSWGWPRGPRTGARREGLTLPVGGLGRVCMQASDGQPHGPERPYRVALAAPGLPPPSP